MSKRVLIFTIIAAVIMVGVWRLRDSPVTEVEIDNNIDEVEEGALQDDKSYVLSVSPRGNKEIVCTADNELVLHVKSGNSEASKVIYKDYSPLSEDPYSIYNFEDYNIQWSESERYVFVRDSIYDIKTDKLIEIKSNVVFMWIGNKGLYMDNGYYYTMHFDDGYSNYMAVSRAINVFEEGDIRTLACAEDDKYFILDNIYMKNRFNITDDCLVVNTASLKYKAEDLQEIIYKEYRKMVNAIYEEKGIDRYEQPEHLIVNGSYYLENIKTAKMPL
ncbi:hypothetical protein [Geosporobacter ferrireducens]|uniref:Uncharacterized protein n=2 Tax=Geosporobacter ferrireducens TaxID=1424294 RepID=A0A1D8GCT8_9FIRM|nr:hypothetical protein [Geosporobacter ferrireducens]AOT68718.1 hypothetical protein Gferi_03470 [Geosporobacter ferrireducens]MTI57606.1 hypothetical protein [Geosporobacter ferrireducens]